MREYLKYPVDPVDIKNIDELFPGDEYLEIWQGLPKVELDHALTLDGQKALRLDYDRNYIWITPMAVQALEEDPQALLVATKVKRANGKFCADWVMPVKGTIFDLTLAETEDTENIELQDVLDYAIQRAYQSNATKIQAAMAKRANDEREKKKKKV